MTSITPFQATDLFKMNPTNLDVLTENYHLDFYLSYLVKWPSLFFQSSEPNGQISGYMMGKTEGELSKNEWHTHITAVTVSPMYRRLGLASYLCEHLELATAGDPYNALFIDLFVRVTNTLAQTLYKKLGYSVYRRVVGYYGREMPENRKKLDDEIDAFDMRKSLPKDVKKSTVRANGEKVYVLPQEVQF